MKWYHCSEYLQDLILLILTNILLEQDKYINKKLFIERQYYVRIWTNDLIILLVLKTFYLFQKDRSWTKRENGLKKLFC